MLYKPNETKWKVGDLVLADADAKIPQMLMVVIGTDYPHTNNVTVRYLCPVSGYGSTREYTGPYTWYHDPSNWLNMPGTTKNVLRMFPPLDKGQQRNADNPAYLAAVAAETPSEAN